MENEKMYTEAELNERLQNTREATERKISKKYEGFISPENEDYSNSMKELNEFRTNKRINEIESTHFNDFKIKSDYKKDIFKLADIQANDDDKAIKTKLTEFSKLDKNKIYFNEETTGVQTETATSEPAPTRSNSGGGSFWNRFKK